MDEIEDLRQNWFTVVIIIAVVLYFAYNKGDTWAAFYYPNGVSGIDIRNTGFKSKNECLDWIDEISLRYNNPEGSDYECGKNCKLKDDLYICDTTER